MFESSSDALFLIASDTGQIIDANKMATELYGYERDEFLTKTNMDLSAEPAETSQQMHEARSTPGVVFFVPLRLHRQKNGSVFPVEITARSLVREGRPVLLVACRDITERRRTEASLQGAERRYRNLFDQANEGLLLMTTDGQVAEANRVFVEMHGYTMDEYKGEHIGDFDVFKEKTMEERADIGRRLKAGEIVHFEVEHYHKDGHVISLAVSSGMITLDGQSFYLASHTDITERKRTEAALRRSYERLALAQRASGSGVWDWDMTSGTLSWTSEMFLLLGLDPETAAATFETWRRTVHPEDVEVATERIDVAVRWTGWKLKVIWRTFAAIWHRPWVLWNTAFKSRAARRPP